MSFVKKKRQLERQFLKKRTPLVIFREGIWVRLRIIAQTCHILLVIFSSIEDQRTLLITILKKWAEFSGFNEYPLHIVWKLLNMSHLNFGILAFSTNFCPIKTYLSGNTVWPFEGFQKLAKLDHFLAFLINFCPLKM